MTAQSRFISIRRAYRAACRLNAAAATVKDGQRIVLARIAACTALRAFTGKWDTCEPAGNIWCGFLFFRREKTKLNVPHVSAACVRWMRADAKGVAA